MALNNRPYSVNELNGLTRQQLCSVIVSNHYRIQDLIADNNRLKAENNSLNNYKILCNCFEEFYSFFDGFGDKFLSDSVLKAKNQIKQFICIKQKECSPVIVKYHETFTNGIGSEQNMESENEEEVSLIDEVVLTDNVLSAETIGDSTGSSDPVVPAVNTTLSDKYSIRNKLTEQWKINLLKSFLPNKRQRFDCTFNGCNQSFNNYRALCTHSVRKHKTKATPRSASAKKFNHIRPGPSSAKTLRSVRPNLKGSQKSNISRLKSNKSSKLPMNGNNGFKCSVIGCGKRFRNYKALHLHSRRSHMLWIDSSSKACNRSANKVLDIDLNEASNNASINGSVGDFNCSVDGCGKQFNKFHKLWLHSMRTHKIKIKKSESQDMARSVGQPSTSLNGFNDDIVTIDSIEDLFAVNGVDNEVNNSLGDQFECLFQGCDQVFPTYKQLNVHSVRKHKIRANDLQNRIIEFSKIGETFDGSKEVTDNNVMNGSQEIDNNMIEIVLNTNSKKKSTETFDCLIDGCNQSFTSYRALNTHSFRKHKVLASEASQSNITITEVEEDDSDKINMNNPSASKPKKKFSRKLKYTSMSAKPFSCDECGKRFRNKYYVNTHKMSHKLKLKSKPYSCEVCGSRFRTKSYINIHMQTHIPPSPTSEPKIIEMFTCTVPGCQATMTDVSALKEHLLIHSDKVLSCRWKACSAMFTTKASLSKHMNKHQKSLKSKANATTKKTGDLAKSKYSSTTMQTLATPSPKKPSRKYCCEWPGCDKTFDQLEQWKEHNSSHNREPKTAEPVEEIPNQCQYV